MSSVPDIKEIKPHITFEGLNIDGVGQWVQLEKIFDQIDWAFFPLKVDITITNSRFTHVMFNFDYLPEGTTKRAVADHILRLQKKYGNSSFIKS
jgi:hypothetical protein